MKAIEPRLKWVDCEVDEEGGPWATRIAYGTDRIPTLTVWRGRGWCWTGWLGDGEDGNNILAGGSGYHSQQNAMIAAERWATNGSRK